MRRTSTGAGLEASGSLPIGRIGPIRAIPEVKTCLNRTRTIPGNVRMEINGKALLPDVNWRALKHAPQNLLTGTFRSLRHPNYRLFFFGQLVSLIGTWLQNTALAWLVYSLTKDSMTLGIMSFLGSVPVLFLSIIAGTVADEHPKRRILVITQAAAGVQAILLAVAIWTHSATILVIGLAN